MAALALAITLPGACTSSYRLDAVDPATLPAEPVARLAWARPLVEHEILTYRPQEWATPAIDRDGGVFVGASSGLFASLDRAGRRRWLFRAEGPVSSQPLLDPSRGAVYFGADDGRMYCIDARTGRVRWRHDTRGTINRAPALSGGLLYFTSNEDRVYAVNATTGAWRWQYDREVPEGFTIHGYAGVAVSGGVLYTGFSDGRVVALKAGTGEVLWTRNLGAGRDRFLDVDTTPTLIDGKLLAASYGGGLYALDPDGGSVIWHRTLTGVTGLSASGRRIYVSSQAGLVTLDLAGRILWSQAIRSGVLARPLALGGGRLLAATGTESPLYLAAAATGRLLQVFDPGYGASASPAAAAGRLALLSNRGVLYVFDLQRGGGYP